MAPGAVAQRAVVWQERPGTWTLNAGIGPSRYLGDLNERFSPANLQLGAALSVAVAYRLMDQLSLRGDAAVCFIRGTHQNTYLAYNNLSFHSLNPDLSVGIQVDFWSSQNRNRVIIPYALAGVGLTYLTPKAHYKGTTYSLAPLQTEGVVYNRLPLLFRYGIGIPLFRSDRLKGVIEGVYSHVQSDYLDDVSTTYPDRSGMPALAASLSDRAPEISMPANPAGAQRGNPGRSDGYLTLTARLVLIISTNRQRAYQRMFGR